MLNPHCVPGSPGEIKKKKLTFHLQELISIGLVRAQALLFSKNISQGLLKYSEDGNHCSTLALDIHFVVSNVLLCLLC